MSIEAVMHEILAESQKVAATSQKVANRETRVPQGKSQESQESQRSDEDRNSRWTVARAEQVKRWLEHIGETHPDIIREVLDRCRDNPDARAFFISRAERELPKPDAPGTTRVTIALPGKAACDMAVPADRVIDFCKEAKRRGLLVRYRLRGHQTISTVMAGPGDTTEALKQRLSDEFGERLAFEPVDDPLFELRERVKLFIAETPTDDDASFEFAYTPANKARDLAEVETADEAKLREWERHRTNCERLGPKPPIEGELA